MGHKDVESWADEEGDDGDGDGGGGARHGRLVSLNRNGHREAKRTSGPKVKKSFKSQE